MSSFRIGTSQMRPGAVHEPRCSPSVADSTPNPTCPGPEQDFQTELPRSTQLPCTAGSQRSWHCSRQLEHSPRALVPTTATLTMRDTSPTPTPTQRTFSPHSALSPVAFIGGAAVALVLVLGGVYCCWRRRRTARAVRRRRDAAAVEMTGGGTAAEGAVV